MELLSGIIRETAENYGLGNKAGPLVAETARLMFEPATGGFKGFIDRLEADGLAEDWKAWLRPQTVLQPLDGKRVEALIGETEIGRVGKHLGMANARVRTAMGAVIPHLVRLVAGEGEVPERLPPLIDAFFENQLRGSPTPRSKSVPRRRSRPEPPRWGLNLGVLVLLVSAVLLGYGIFQGEDPPSTPPSEEVSTPDAGTEAVKAPTEMPEPTGASARLVLRYDGNHYEYSGVVAGVGMNSEVMTQLQTFLGKAKLTGSLIHDAKVASPAWLLKLDRVLPLLSVPGLDVRFEGNTVRVGGWLSDSDRESVLNSLKTALGPDFRYGYLREEELELTLDARQQMLAAIDALPNPAQPQELVPVLNRWVINFGEEGATFPDDAREVAVHVAGVLKAMRPEAILEIQGHMDARPNGGIALTRQSLDRANAVRGVLVENGVPAAMLRTKGFGGDRPVAANDTPLGHFRNRRIEFRIAQVCDQYFPCESLNQVPRPSPTPSPAGEDRAPAGLVPAAPPAEALITPPAPKAAAPMTPEPPVMLTAPKAPMTAPEPSLPSGESARPNSERRVPEENAVGEAPASGGSLAEPSKDAEAPVARPKGRWIPPGETAPPKRRVLTEDPPIIRPKKTSPAPAPAAPKPEDEWYDPFDLF